MIKLTLSLFIIASVLSFGFIEDTHENKMGELYPPYYTNSKPYTRWWWFASNIKKEDVVSNLDWLKANNFGGVEIAWIYPYNRKNENSVQQPLRMKWLSSEWSGIVAFTKQYADSIGLGCDFTFGSLWPFAGKDVPGDEASRVLNKPGWTQEVHESWDYPEKWVVIDHLNKTAFEHYSQKIGEELSPALSGTKSSIFVDSWEIETRRLWTNGLGEKFENQFGYSIMPYMDSLYSPQNSNILYDYMKLISRMVIENFYEPFTKKAHELGAFSRGQCCGAPCDILSAYSRMDIPESEAMLYEPAYSQIPASAAALCGKPVVSSETFTCLYGWPDLYLMEEQTADLKMVADALFANGVNQVIWHGKPFNPKGEDTIKFYASVHIGHSSPMAEEIPAFNNYMEKVSSFMKEGETYSRVAVYLPLEDSWTTGKLPREKQFIWSWGDYEFRYRYMPDELKPYRPLWINREFLEKAVCNNGLLEVGPQTFHVLYIDVEYMDYYSLKRVIFIAESGLPVVLKRIPKQAGHISNPDFISLCDSLSGFKNVVQGINMLNGLKPLVEGEGIPDYWCRKEGEQWYFFFSNPKSQNLKFPIKYGQSFSEETKIQEIKFNLNSESIPYTLVFKPYQSILLKINGGRIELEDTGFLPKTPKKKERIHKGKERWEVE